MRSRLGMVAVLLTCAACALPGEDGKPRTLVDPVSADVAVACEQTARPGCLAACKNTGACFTGGASDVNDVHCTERSVTFWLGDATGDFKQCFLPAGSFLPDSESDNALVAARKRAFMTATTWNGDLASAGGTADVLIGADLLCADAAASANLAGKWKAFLGTESADPAERMLAHGGWYTVARSARLYSNISEIGVSAVESIEVTDESGSVTMNTAWIGKGCAGWTTSSKGERTGRSMRYTNSAASTSASCDEKHALLCLEQ